MAAVPAHPANLAEVDFFDPATQEEWYPTYDLLREQAPVWQMPGTNTFVLTRYDDIQYVLQRIDLFLRGASESTPSSGASSRIKEIYDARSTGTSPIRSSRRSDPRSSGR